MKKLENAAVLAVLREIATADPEQLLRPEAVVQAAAQPDSPLHAHFTWDDSQAASQWRLEEARSLIRGVELEYDASWARGPVPAFVSLMNDRGNRSGGGYRHTPQVLSDQKLRAELAATARKELESWARRHKMMRSLVVAVLQSSGIPLTGVFSEAEVAIALQEASSEAA